MAQKTNGKKDILKIEEKVLMNTTKQDLNTESSLKHPLKQRGQYIRTTNFAKIDLKIRSKIQFINRIKATREA